ncbi:MAG: hypothetical protein V7785_05220 [Bermanella sp.]
MKKNILMVGASGEVGQRLVKQLLLDTRVDCIHLLNRRQLKMNDPRVIQHQVDFNQLNTLDLKLDFNLAYCCLGSTIKQAGSKAAFEKVDLHYVTEFAQLAQRHNAARFAVISSIGANAHKGGFYLQTKGRMEEALQAMTWQQLWVFRPSLLIGQRKQFRLAEQFGALASKLISPLLVGPLKNYRPIEMDNVANAMASILGLNQMGTSLIENTQILSLAKR